MFKSLIKTTDDYLCHKPCDELLKSIPEAVVLYHQAYSYFLKRTVCNTTIWNFWHFIIIQDQASLKEQKLPEQPIINIA